MRVLSSVDVFQETSQVHVSNVRTHSDKDYVAGPVRLGETYYTDRTYIITGLPDFLHGLEGVQTPNNDKHSDPADLQWLCFDVSQRAAVYVLYDRRVEDSGGTPPDWLTRGFNNEHIATVSHTDSPPKSVHSQISDGGRPPPKSKHSRVFEPACLRSRPPQDHPPRQPNLE